MEYPLRSFWRKDRFRSGHGAMTSYEVQPSTDFFKENRVFNHVTCCHSQEWRYYALFWSAQDHIWPLTLHLHISKVIRGQWPWLGTYMPKVANLAVMGVSWSPETEGVSNVCIDMFIVPLYTSRCQSCPLNRFALKWFCRWGWRCSLPGCYASQTFHP